MAAKKSGSNAASVQTVEKASKAEQASCGIQFQTEEERKSHEERHSCCNYRLYSHYQRRQT